MVITTGALIITNTILGGPENSYSIMGPKTLFGRDSVMSFVFCCALLRLPSS